MDTEATPPPDWEALQYYKNPADRYGSAIIELTNPVKDIRQLELFFAGKTEKPDGTIEQIQEPLMNEKGIKRVIGQVKSFAHQSGIFSNIEEKEIKAMVLDFSDTLITDLMFNRKEFGIRKSTDRNVILTSAREVIWLVLKRATEGAEKRFWGKIQHEFSQQINAPQKKSMFEKMTKWGSKNF